MSGHPTLSIEDLAVAMRTFGPNQKNPELIVARSTQPPKDLPE